jgi:carbon-monoxide dehydrogenase medium subunit
LLQQHGEDAKLVAGGHSLIPAMKLRLSQPSVLIDIAGMADLKGIAVNGAELTIGAGETYRAIATSDTVKHACGVIAACGWRKSATSKCAIVALLVALWLTPILPPI